MKDTKKKKDSREFMLKNELVKQLPDEYVKNPLSFAQICGDFSLSQTNLMIAMVSQMQDRINELLKVPTDQMLLFPPEETLNDDLELTIPLNSLGVIPQRYGELDAALDALHTMKITYEERDANGVVYKVRNNIIGKSKIPIEEVGVGGNRIQYKGGARRRGCITITVRKDAVKDLFNLRKGYTEHLKGIVKLCRRSRTPRLYIYLSSWRKKGTFVTNFNDLKEFLGVLTYNRERTKIVENKYSKYGDFKRYVMEPVEEEMRSLAEQNKIEFYFTYQALYNSAGKKSGNPDRIMFTLHNTQKGIDFDLNKRIERLHATLIRSFNLQQREWEKFAYALNKDTEKQISSQLFKIAEAVKKNEVEVPHAYVTAYIMNELGIQDVEPEEIVEDTTPELTDADLETWDNFCEKVVESVSEDFYDIFVTPCHLQAVERDKVTVMVPTSFVHEEWTRNAEGVMRAIEVTFGRKRLELTIDPEYV